MHQHRSLLRPPTTTTRPRRSRLLPWTAVLLAGLLTACTGDPASPDDPSTDAGAEGGSGPAAADEHGEHGDHADHSSQVAVGPLELPAAEYWSVLQPADGVTQVRAGGCPEDAACPSFEILSGAAVEGVDPAEAHVPDGATCPGSDALAARPVAKASETDVEVAGQAASLARWTLSCVDGAGAEVRTVEQLQWYVPDGPAGPVLVVDRWAFEGLESRLAAGGWAAA